MFTNFACLQNEHIFFFLRQARIFFSGWLGKFFTFDFNGERFFGGTWALYKRILMISAATHRWFPSRRQVQRFFVEQLQEQLVLKWETKVSSSSLWLDTVLDHHQMEILPRPEALYNLLSVSVIFDFFSPFSNTKIQNIWCYFVLDVVNISIVSLWVMNFEL